MEVCKICGRWVSMMVCGGVYGFVHRIIYTILFPIVPCGLDACKDLCTDS